MITNFLHQINAVFQPIQAIPVKKPVAMQNPFASPFIASMGSSPAFTGVNQPIKGGYFAGYYNGKKNIVGRKLFVNA